MPWRRTSENFPVSSAHVARQRSASSDKLLTDAAILAAAATMDAVSWSNSDESCGVVSALKSNGASRGGSGGATPAGWGGGGPVLTGAVDNELAPAVGTTRLSRKMGIRASIDVFLSMEQTQQHAVCDASLSGVSQ